MNIYNKAQINDLVKEIKSGKTVAFGTDTVFGLACSVSIPEAKNRVYLIKGRDTNKKLPMMFSSIEMMEKYVEILPKTRRLIKEFSPGPITYILKEKKSSETIACRIPDDEWIINLIEKLDEPLYVTSANISGQESLLKVQEVKDTLKDVDVLVDKDANGKCASTIVDVINDYKIIRQGPISHSQIQQIIK